LGGEGLQHQDGSSHVSAATIPNCRAYDPAFASELAVILDHGARQMMEHGADVFYYLTVMNENYPQLSLPANAAVDVIRGAYRLRESRLDLADGYVRLLGSGAVLREVIAASEMLAQDWQIESEVWSVTSFSELAKDAREVERWNRLHPEGEIRRSHLVTCLGGSTPIVAATDYVRAYPQLIASYLEAPYTTLGTDGFGRSDTRAALRRFFEVDRHQICVASLHALQGQGIVASNVVAAALEKYGIDTNAPAPWDR
jgi:pyruvate dehydrogenase E1 component